MRNAPSPASPNWAPAFAGVVLGGRKARSVLASVGLLAFVSGTASAQDAPAPASQQAPADPAAAAPAGDQSGGLVVDVTGGISAPMPIAIPVMPTSAVVSTPAGSTDVLGRQLADIVTNDLRNSGLFTPLSPGQLRPITFPEVTAPGFDLHVLGMPPAFILSHDQTLKFTRTLR